MPITYSESGLPIKKYKPVEIVCLNCHATVEVPRGPGRPPTFCSANCNRAYTTEHGPVHKRRRSREVHILLPLLPPHISSCTSLAMARHLVIADLMRLGHHLYSSILPTSPYELVAATPKGDLKRVKVCWDNIRPNFSSADLCAVVDGAEVRYIEEFKSTPSTSPVE